jgi:uncharacterized protein YneF (UPF0154 family)
MTHILIVSFIALAVLFAGFIVGMCITAKRADKAIANLIATMRDKGAL